MVWEKKRLLVWGTTYPEFSKKYRETVCTGAIDADTGRLVRIYPISLRYMKERFRHYNWIEAEVARNTGDFRPESYKINQDSIRIVATLGTDDGWAERSRWVLRRENVFPSVRALQEAEARDHTSLGLVRPKVIRRVFARPRSEAERAQWETHRAEAIRQCELLVDVETATRDLVFMPIEYRVVFVCDDVTCPTEHNMSILDWGVYVLSRKQYAERGAALAERDVASKIKSLMDASKRRPYFFLGNTKQHSHNFMVVGMYYPPLPKHPEVAVAKPQLNLF